MRPFSSGCPRFFPALLSLAFLILGLFASPRSAAQTQQPFLFASDISNGQIADIAVFVRNDRTGDLTEVAGSPFTAIHSYTCGMTIIDPLGRFGYGPCGLGTAMYSINATTGAVAEVSGSPFANSTGTNRGAVAAESTGQYVYVLKYSLSDIYPNTSTVVLDTFQVDATNEQLDAENSQSIGLDGTLVSVSASPRGYYLLVNQNQDSESPAALLYAFLFDPSSGQASALQQLSSVGDTAHAMLIDFAAKNLVISSGQTCGALWFLQLSPADGTIIDQNSGALPCERAVDSLLAFDPTSSFVYFQYAGGADTSLHIFSASTQTELASSPVPANLQTDIGGVPDPQAALSFLQGAPGGTGISVFGVDSTTGYPLAPSAFTNPLFAGRALVVGPATIDLNTQPVQAPAVSLTSTTLSFGSATIGQTSPSQNVTLTNTGNLTLSLTSIQVTGTNAADFTESDNCMSPPQLQPTKSCIITVTYHPSSTASGSATVLVADNASGSPQQIALSGTGTNPAPPPPAAPAVSLNPNQLSFPGTITEGTLSAAQNLMLTNSGNATLHIQTIVLSGSNSTDFTISSNNCVGALAANANCTVAITFSPLGPGVRNATLTITDDASNSPQSINILGNGGAAAQISAASSGSTAVSVTAGQSAQFTLQAVPGANFTGTLVFTCTGAPTAATCNAPASLNISNGAATTFTVTVTTSGSSSLIPFLSLPRGFNHRPHAYSLWLAFAIVLLAHLQLKDSRQIRRRCYAGITAILLVSLTLTGCGGSSAFPTPTTTPTNVVTPSGIYTITLTPTATASGTAKQFQLAPLSLTLTVN